MRHTLIPPQERLRIHREYRLRLLIVGMSVLSVAILLSAAGLSPAYFSAWSANRAALSSLAVEKKADAKSGLSDITKKLDDDGKILKALSSGSDASRLSEVIQSVSAARSSVEIASFNVNRQSDSVIVTTVSGQAGTRAELLSFKSRLEALSPGTSVDLPLSELAKSANISFSMRITQAKP